jgi:hypothetical protein
MEGLNRNIRYFSMGTAIAANSRIASLYPLDTG